jgi:hypothetical protein
VRILRARTAVRWSAAAVGAVIAITACGPLQLGAVATYGNQRITTQSLSAQVADLNSAYQADKTKVKLGYSPAEMPREALSWMLRFAAREQLAARQGITVTTGEEQRSLAAIELSVRQNGGGTLAQAAVAAGLPPDLLTELGRYVAIQSKLENRLDQGVVPKTSAAAQALNVRFNRLECLVAKSMNIAVNPQYGALDYSQYAVVPVTSALAAPEPGASKPSASPAPQLTPSC